MHALFINRIRHSVGKASYVRCLETQNFPVEMKKSGAQGRIYFSLQLKAKGRARVKFDTSERLRCSFG